MHRAVALAVALDELDQTPRDASGRVVGAELDPLAVGVPHAAAPRLQEQDGQTGVVLEEDLEAVGRDDERLDRLEGRDRRRPGALVEGREVTEQLARPPDGEHDLFAVGGVARDLRPAGEQDDHVVGRLTLGHDERAAPERAPHATGDQVLELLGRQRRREALEPALPDEAVHGSHPATMVLAAALKSKPDGCKGVTDRPRRVTRAQPRAFLYWACRRPMQW